MKNNKLKVILSENELSLLQTALNEYWHLNNLDVQRGFKLSYDGTKHPLGDIEKKIKEKSVDKSKKLLDKMLNTVYDKM